MNDAQFTGWMKQMDDRHSGAALPDAEAIWWRARLQQQLAMEERVTRPLRIVEGLACAMCLAGAVVLSVVTALGKL